MLSLSCNHPWIPQQKLNGFFFGFLIIIENNLCEISRAWVKGLVRPKIKILSLITHPYVIPNPN